MLVEKCRGLTGVNDGASAHGKVEVGGKLRGVLGKFHDHINGGVYMHPVEYEILDADFVKHRLDVLKAAVCAAFIELASKDDRALSVVLEKLAFSFRMPLPKNSAV